MNQPTESTGWWFDSANGWVQSVSIEPLGGGAALVLVGGATPDHLVEPVGVDADVLQEMGVQGREFGADEAVLMPTHDGPGAGNNLAGDPDEPVGNGIGLALACHDRPIQHATRRRCLGVFNRCRVKRVQSVAHSLSNQDWGHQMLTTRRLGRPALLLVNI